MNDETVRRTLTRAWGLIADEDHWCQGALAKDGAGRSVAPSSKRAVAWCAEGAVMCAAPGKAIEKLALARLDDVANDRFDTYPTSINDSLGHAAVARLFDTAVV